METVLLPESIIQGIHREVRPLLEALARTLSERCGKLVLPVPNILFDFAQAGEFLRERGIVTDPLGDFRFARRPEEIRRSGIATGCDDYAKLFVQAFREAGGDASMVWMASRTELVASPVGSPLAVEGRPILLDPANPGRLVSGHQVALVVEGGGGALVDPSFEGEGRIPLASLGEPEDLVGKEVGGDLVESYWPGLARAALRRGRAGEGFVIRAVSADLEFGNSAAKNQRIYASGDPLDASLIVRQRGTPGLG